MVTPLHTLCRILTEAQRLWRKVPNEYDDYIANPKQSGYRSLHTCVKGGVQTVPLPRGTQMLSFTANLCTHGFLSAAWQRCALPVHEDLQH